MIVDKSPRWWLGNAEERESDLFQIPPRNIRHALRRRKVAKLLFEFAPGDDGCQGERMWVEVVSVRKRAAGPLYIGVLANDPVYLGEVLKLGSQVVFGPEHVVDVDDVESERGRSDAVVMKDWDKK